MTIGLGVVLTFASASDVFNPVEIPISLVHILDSRSNKTCARTLTSFYGKFHFQISQLPSKLRFSANCSFFGQSFSPAWALSSDISAVERGLFTMYI